MMEKHGQSLLNVYDDPDLNNNLLHLAVKNNQFEITEYLVNRMYAHINEVIDILEASRLICKTTLVRHHYTWQVVKIRIWKFLDSY